MKRIADRLIEQEMQEAQKVDPLIQLGRLTNKLGKLVVRASAVAVASNKLQDKIVELVRTIPDAEHLLHEEPFDSGGGWVIDDPLYWAHDQLKSYFGNLAKETDETNR
jgi:hypothetical protein